MSLIAATWVWFFLVQMPGDSTWSRVGLFTDKYACEEYRINFDEKHQNFISQPCTREWQS